MLLISFLLKSVYRRQEPHIPFKFFLNVFEVSLPFKIHILDKLFFNRRMHSEWAFLPKIMATFFFLIEKTFVFLAVCDSFKFLVFRFELAEELLQNSTFLVYLLLFLFNLSHCPYFSFQKYSPRVQLGLLGFGWGRLLFSLFFYCLSVVVPLRYRVGG